VYDLADSKRGAVEGVVRRGEREGPPVPSRIAAKRSLIQMG